MDSDLAKQVIAYAASIALSCTLDIDQPGWRTTVTYNGQSMTFNFNQALGDTSSPPPTPSRAISALWAHTQVIRKYRTLELFAHFMAGTHHPGNARYLSPQSIAGYEKQYQQWLENARQARVVFGESFGESVK